MRDTSAVAALQNAHPRQLLSYGALAIKSLLLPGTPFPRETVFGDVYVDDLAMLAIVETFERAFDEDHLRMNRADAMYAALGMPIKKQAGDGEFAGPIWGAQLDGQRGKLTFPVCRPATLPTCLGAFLVVNSAQLKRLIGAWGFSLSFRRECFSFLDISFVAAESLPSRKPCKLSGPLLDELILVSVLAPRYSTDLRSPPLTELFAFDAWMRAQGGEERLSAKISDCFLCDLFEERGEHVRLDWDSQPTDPVFSDTRAAAACSSREALFLVCVQGSQGH